MILPFHDPACYAPLRLLRPHASRFTPHVSRFTLPAWIPFKVRSRATADGHLDLSQSPTVAEQDFAANQPAFSDEAKLTAQWPALRSRLADLAPLALEIHDDSADHAGHAGAAAGGGHFSLLIVSQAFDGVPRLKRHQTVIALLADLLPHPIHALSIKALAPEEFS